MTANSDFESPLQPPPAPAAQAFFQAQNLPADVIGEVIPDLGKLLNLY